MDIANYLNQPGALTISRIAERLAGAPNNSIVRQWCLGMRRPSPVRCVELTRIDKRMTLQALRPVDWFLIWPRLPGASRARVAQALTSRTVPATETAATTPAGLV